MKHPHAYRYVGPGEGSLIGFGYVAPDKIVIAHTEAQQQAVDNSGERYFEKFDGDVAADNLALAEGQTFSDALITHSLPAPEAATGTGTAEAPTGTAEAAAAPAGNLAPQTPATPPVAPPDTEATK